MTAISDKKMALVTGGTRGIGARHIGNTGRRRLPTS